MSEQAAATAADTTATQKIETTGAADTKAASAVSGTPATLATGGDDTARDTTAATTTATTPATEASWRDRMVGDDKASLKVLERYSDEAAFFKAHRALQQKVSSGELKPSVPFPDKGTPEQQAEWRKEQGIPDKPEAYQFELPPGVVAGEADKPGLEWLAQQAHAKNWSTKQLSDVAALYFARAQAVEAERTEADGQFRQTAEDALRADWGPDFRPNLNAVKNFLSAAPKEVSDRLLNGRTADGKKIGDDPAVLKWLAQTARELNPAASILPAGNSSVQGIEARLAEIRKHARENPREYDQDHAMQAEQTKLIEAQQRMKARG